MNTVSDWFDNARSDGVSLFLISDEEHVRSSAADEVEGLLRRDQIDVARMPWGMIASASGRDDRLLHDGLFSDPWSDSVVKSARQAGVLVVDDLGIGSPSYDEIHGFFALVDRRYMDLRPMVATTPLHPELLQAQLALSGEQLVAEKIVSRLCQDAVIVEL